jgi:3-polyprenyl-4-hydroxybenzoate decarboxylase
MFGCFHNCAFVKIRKTYPLQARRVMHAIWGAGQMAWTKYIVVVDDDVNVHDEQAVLRAMFEHCHFARDVELVHGPLDILDHAAAHLGAGGKMGFDATRKIRGEDLHGISINVTQVKPRDGHPSALPTGAFAPPFGADRCNFLAVEKKLANDGACAIEELWNETPQGMAELVIAVDSSVDVRDWQSVLFHWCANTDPSRDVLRSGPRIGFDATRKMKGDERHGQPVRDYPPIMEMDEATKRAIDTRVTEFGLR